MQSMSPIPTPALSAAAATLLMLLTGACSTQKTTTSQPGEKPQKSEVDVSFLLSMSFEEAGAISTSRGEVPGVARVAADSIEVLKFGRHGEMRRLRARGNVFVEMDGGGEPARALAQEAYINENEVILRGMPALQRGPGLLEGLTDKTVFYIFGSQVRALGRHRIKSGLTPPASAPDEAAVLAIMRSPPAKPPKLPEAGPWRGGPNPLLPPLDDTAVPESVKTDMRKQAEAEAVLQQARQEAVRLPDTPLNLPDSTPAPKPDSPASPPSTVE